MMFSIVQRMTADEVRNFKLQMERISWEVDKKTILLFDLLRKSDGPPETAAVVRKLYGEDTPKQRNNLYSVRSRLAREIRRSLLHQHFEIDKEQQALNEFIFAKVQRKHGNIDLSKSALQSTLKMARKNDLFEIMDMVYKELLSLAADDQSIDLEGLVEARNENSRKLELLRDTQNKIAVVTHKLRKSNFAQEDAQVLELMEEVRSISVRQEDFYLSSKGRIRLFNLTSGILLRQGAFAQLEIYLRSEYAFFDENGLFNKDTHRTRIIMLTWLINATYKNLKFEDSLDYCFQMKEAMEAYGRRFYNAFVGHLFNSFVNNYVCLDRLGDALSIQEDLLDQKELKFAGNTVIYLLLNLASVHYYCGKRKKALKVIARIYEQEAYPLVNAFGQLQIELFEASIQFELRDFDYLDTRLGKLSEKYSEELVAHPAQSKLLQLLLAMTEYEFAGGDALKGEAVLQFMKDKDTAGFENEILNPYLWLEALKTGRSYHQLRLVEIAARKN